MVALLKALRRNGDNAALSEMRQIAARLNGERATLDTLIGRADRSADELGRLATPITEMNERLAAVERRMSEIDARLPAIVTAQDRADAFVQTHEQIDAKLADSERRAARIEDQLEGVERLVGSAATLRNDLGQLLDAGGPFAALKADAEALKAGIGPLTATVSHLREARDDLEQGTRQATARVQALETSSQAAARTADDCRRRVDVLEQRIGGLGRLAAEASETRHQLLTLKALTDQVTQKAAALETQRDALERYARNASHLEQLAHRVDAAIREKEQQLLQLQSVGSSVDEARSLYESVVARSDEIRARQQSIDEQDRGTRQKLEEMHAVLQRAAERFDVEHRGLETVSHRMADLRAGVTACEEQIQRLDTSRVSTMATKLDEVWNRVGYLMSDVAHVEQEAKKMRALRAEAYRIRDVLMETAARTAQIEKGRAKLDELAAALRELSGTHDAVKQALETVRGAQDDLAQARRSQMETTSWVAAVREPVAELEARMQRLEGMTPTLDSVQKRVEWVVEMLDVVANRRQVLDEMQRRIGDLTTLAAQLEQRAKTFRSRLDVAEGRFMMVTKQAEDAERVANLVTGASAMIAQIDGRVSELGRTVASFQGRAQDVESLAARTEALGRELETRQTALDRAGEHLAEASKLREESAVTVQELDARVHAARAALGTVDQRAERLELLSDELESRSAALEAVAQQMSDLDQRVEQWKIANDDLGLSLERVTMRQSTVDVLQGRFAEMFELAERIANDVQAAGEVRRDIEQMRQTLDALSPRLRDAAAAIADVDCRQREIEHAERRLARAEAVLIGIQSSLETLHAQRATLDQVIEKAGVLTFEVQQGEALIDRLRMERHVMNSVRVARDDADSTTARAGAESPG